MECSKVMEVVLTQDNGAELSATVHEHLRECEQCRTQATLINGAIAALQQTTAKHEDTVLTNRIMSAIRNDAADLQPVALRGWVVVGAVMLAGLFGLRFSRWMADLRSALGPSVDIATGLVLGLLLTGYLCMLVASNFDRVSRVFRHR